MQEYLEYSDNDILERVDEYSLYCHYLEFEPIIGKKYSSPIRLGDEDPSFAIFERRYGFGTIMPVSEFLWKDQAVTTHGPQDIFDLIAILNGYTSRIQAYWKVCGDFGLGGAPIIESRQILFKEPKYLEPIDIKVKSREFNKRDTLYWKQYNVNEPILRQYNCSAIECYWLTKTQQYPGYPKGLGFAYRIYNKYQLYFPFQIKKKKFRNNWIDSCIPGFQQLQNTDTCIITKAYKDVMSLRGFGFDAIAPRGENIMLPNEVIEYISKRYKNVFTLFDNDGKHKAHQYPFRECHIPLESGQKDLTDYCAYYGVDKTYSLLKTLL